MSDRCMDKEDEDSMDYYSAIKRNDNGSFVEMWMDLESVLEYKVIQKEKTKCHILMHVCGT